MQQQTLKHIHVHRCSSPYVIFLPVKISTFSPSFIFSMNSTVCREKKWIQILICDAYLHNTLLNIKTGNILCIQQYWSCILHCRSTEKWWLQIKSKTGGRSSIGGLPLVSKARTTKSLSNCNNAKLKDAGYCQTTQLLLSPLRNFTK